MVTASAPEVCAAAERFRNADSSVSAALFPPFTFKLATIASERGGTRARSGHVLW